MSKKLNEINTVCIKQNWPTRTYDLQFFPECNDDDVVRDDLKDLFYSDPDYFDYYDIKVFSQTPKEDYEKILPALEQNLSTRSKTIHLSNASWWMEDWIKGYEDFEINSSIYDRIIDTILSSPNAHEVEIHIKRRMGQEWNSEGHNKKIDEIITRMDNASNIRHICITGSQEIHSNETLETQSQNEEIYNNRYMDIPTLLNTIEGN